MRTTRLFCSVLALAALSGIPAYARDLTVAENGHSDYVIVRPETPSAVDDFATGELSKFLKQSTGADFAVESPDKITEGQKKIFVGLSGPALKVLGEDPLKGMEDQEHVARSAGDDIFLYGKGLHGNLYAVYEFLENSVGCRWYSAYGGMNIPRHETLRLAEFNRRTQFAFRYRTMVTASYFLLRPESMLFLYRNRFNLEVEEDAKIKGVVDAVKIIRPFVHTLFCYIPPSETPKYGSNSPMDFLKNKNYFKSNPEFFSMDEKGVRVDNRQLCFSNKELRRTLTANVEENLKLNGGRGVISVSANDGGGNFCCCPECLKLTKQYSAVGGPMFDYLLELCGELKEKFPEAQVSTLAYNKNQTQTPPRVERLPDNLIVVFAPINDNFAADWSDPSNAETYRDLTHWCKLSRNVWLWYYTNPYVQELAVNEPIPPFGNIGRLVNDIRLMKKAGVAGMYFEHDVGQHLGDGFFQLQTYLMVKLFQNPDADAGALVSEFMAFQYGQAAPSIKSYLDELEGLRKELGHISWSPSPWMFRYLTPERLARWEGDFDRMEQSVANDSQCHFNVQLVRVGLDLSVLRAWRRVQKALPDRFKDAEPFATRVRAVYERAGREHASPALVSSMRLEGLYASLDALLSSVKNQSPAGKPLPSMFAGIASDRIIRVVVSTDWTGSGVKDADAAFGVAGECPTNGPFPFGLYDATTGKNPLQRTLQPSEIKPGVYAMYKLGTAELTLDCYVWLSSSWRIQSKLDKFYEPGAASRYDIYASMKFEGPSYEKDSKLKEDRFRCDQVVLVKKDTGFIR